MEHRQLVKTEWKKWTASVGGLQTATLLIKECLECSESKAEKLAAGRYPSGLTASEQIALSELTNRPRDVMFRLVGASRKLLRAS
jgi:hypothetical protein